MAKRVAAAALQYSKWLSRFICWVWAFYRFSVLIAAAIQPSIAQAIAATIPGIDTIMLVNEGTYLVNSLGEKYLYSDRFILRWIDKGGFQHLIGNIAAKLNKQEGEEDGDELSGSEDEENNNG